MQDTQDDKNREFGIGSSERESEVKVQMQLELSEYRRWRNETESC